MRRLPWLALIGGLLIGPATAAAQPQAIWGAFAGPSTSHLGYGGHASSHYRHHAVTGGFSLRVRVWPGMSLAGNLLYSAKGYTQPDASIESSYLELPVVFLIELAHTRRRVQPFFGAGFAPAVRLACEREILTISGPHADDCATSQAAGLILAGLRGWDLGLDARAGLRVRLGPGAAALEGRATWGVINLEAGRGTRNRFSALTLGYEWSR